VTTRTYSDFELSVDFKTSPGANSGIMYFVDLNLMPWKNGHGSPIGFEYQVLDDALHPDAKRGKNGDRTVASLYDMIPAAADKPIKPVGEWNTARIVVHGEHGEQLLSHQTANRTTAATFSLDATLQLGDLGRLTHTGLFPLCVDPLEFGWSHEHRIDRKRALLSRLNPVEPSLQAAPVYMFQGNGW
jgi:hypothetical protein